MKVISQKQKSFTLLEVILAMAIVSVALVTIMFGFSIVTQSSVSIDNYSQAMYLIEHKMHQSKLGIIDKPTSEGSFEPPYDKFNWKIQESKAESSQFKKIEVTVYWPQRGKTKSLNALTYFRNYEK